MKPHRFFRFVTTAPLLCTPALAFQVGVGGSAEITPGENPTNIVLILIDDVGTDLLGIYDSVNPYSGVDDPFESDIYVEAPTIDSIAEKAVKFNNAYATPVCSSTRASILTGVRTTRHGIGKIIREDLVGDLVEFGDPGFEHFTLAEMVHTRGLQAAIFGKWHLSLFDEDPSPNGPLGWSGIRERGHWDEIRCTFGNLDMPPFPEGGGYYSYYQHIDTNGMARTSVLTDYATTQQFSDALEYCNTAQEPFLAYVSTNACHPPLGELPPRNLVNTPEHLRGTPNYHKNFSATLEALDTELGNFLDGLNPERRENTVFILMGDNGTDEQLFNSMINESGLDLGATYQALVEDPQLRFKHSVYEGALRVPLLVWGKGVENPGRTSDVLVSVTDLFPTIADLLDADPGVVDGYSFEPVLQDERVGLWNHARQSVVVDFFFENGVAEDATDMRQACCLLNVPDQGQFKLVRKFGLPGWSNELDYMPPPGIVWDEFFQISDSQGVLIDPRELSPLATDVNSPYRDTYVLVSDALDEALYPALVRNYCESFPNSSGRAATIGMEGTTSVDTNDLVLKGSGVPPNTPAFFFYSWYESAEPFVNGLLCVESLDVGLYRFNLTFSNENGELEQVVDHASSNSMMSDISVGSTWKFQAWYRDVSAGGAMSNTTNGLSVHFTP